MCAIAFSEIRGVGTRYFDDNFRQLRTAYAEDTFIAMWKWPASQENRGDGSVFQRQRFEKFADKCDLRGLFLVVAATASHVSTNRRMNLSACALHPHRLATWAPERSARIKPLFA